MTPRIVSQRPAGCSIELRKISAATLALLFLGMSPFLCAEIAATGTAADSGQTSCEERQLMSGKEQFTGTILPVFYVKDVLRSVAFWQDSLGFECSGFYDYEAGASVTEWTKDTPAIYAGMHAGPLEFALHRASDPDSLQVGGMIHYFEVPDVYQSYERLKSRGVDVSSIYERPWMNMFRVNDPDGHRIFFFTRPEEWGQ